MVENERIIYKDNKKLFPLCHNCTHKVDGNGEINRGNIEKM